MCGIFGVYGASNAAEIAYHGIFSLQHRGEESAGIATATTKEIIVHKSMGLVQEVFNKENLSRLLGHSAIAHTRYSTTGGSNLSNCQPFVVNSHLKIAIAHNGNLVNSAFLRKMFTGNLFYTTTDTELLLALIVSESNIKDGIRKIFEYAKGAYSLVILTPNELIAVRDAYGFRPLCLGKKDNAYIVASETCSLETTGAQFIRDIQPGEVVYINHNGVSSEKILPPSPSYCAFEYVYFARPDSVINGESVYQVRKNLGVNLAKESPSDADAVVPIPDSGIYAAIGYCQHSGLPIEMGYMRSHYIGRSFIKPSKQQREMEVELKIRVIKDAIRNKRLVVIDDSIVRGNTARQRMKVLKEAGAKEIHLKISCPPMRYPCWYGIDFPTKEELVASDKTVEEVRKYISGGELFEKDRVDSLTYLSLEGLLNSFNNIPREHLCTACWSGIYPIEPSEKIDKFALES